MNVPKQRPDPDWKRRKALLTALAVATLFSHCGNPAARVPPADAARARTYLEAVREHLDTVLEKGRDRYGKATPLLVDGLEIATYAPVTWTFDDHVWILSNLANQQDLMRSLAGYATLTGETAYRRAAVDIIRYHFDHLKTPNGLIYWGGHTAIDATTDEWVGRRFHWLGKKRSPIHEIKSCYPYYELFWEVDRKATAQLIRSCWAAHIRDWKNLDFDRHGGVDVPSPPPGTGVWDQAFDPDSPVFFRSRGRTFVNTGSDLYFAGGLLFHLAGERPALEWARRIAGRYVATRDPKTGLRGYQYSNLEEVDRAFEQFGDLFPGRLVSEAAIFDPNALTKPLLAQLRLAETLGAEGRDFLEWAVGDLVAVGRTAYDPGEGSMKTLLLDGSDLTASPMPRDGYFGPKGTTFRSWPAADYFLCYAAASRLHSDPFLWEMARRTGSHAGIGDIGARDGTGTALDPGTGADSPNHLMALLELHRATGRRDYLDQACRIGDNLLANRFENGLFTPGPGFRFTRTSRPEPLALLHLAGALLGRARTLPDFMDGHAYFACEQKRTDPAYVFDHEIIYSRPRQPAEPSERPATGPREGPAAPSSPPAPIPSPVPPP